jgi:hypothetical protein
LPAGNNTRFLQVLGNYSSTSLSSISSPFTFGFNASADPLGNFSNLPAEKVMIDWSAYAGEVRYQGYCGACYAFATVDTVSMHFSIYRFGFFLQLSVQQVIDCPDNGLTYGCSGGYL